MGSSHSTGFLIDDLLQLWAVSGMGRSVYVIALFVMGWENTLVWTAFWEERKEGEGSPCRLETKWNKSKGIIDLSGRKKANNLCHSWDNLSPGRIANCLKQKEKSSLKAWTCMRWFSFAVLFWSTPLSHPPFQFQWPSPYHPSFKTVIQISSCFSSM